MRRFVDDIDGAPLVVRGGLAGVVGVKVILFDKVIVLEVVIEVQRRREVVVFVVFVVFVVVVGGGGGGGGGGGLVFFCFIFFFVFEKVGGGSLERDAKGVRAEVRDLVIIFFWAPHGTRVLRDGREAGGEV